MLKNNNHIRLRHKAACDRVIGKIERNPDAFNGISIPARETINDNSRFRNLGIIGLFMAFLVKVSH